MLRRRHGHRDATPGTPPADRARPDQRRILVLSASMGAGHDGAARELAHRLRSEGHAVEVRDFLEAGPIRMGAALKIGYRFELSHAPSMYDATYRFWQRVPGLCPLVAWLVAALTGRRVLRWVSEGGFDLVVSTYPLSTLCLGHLRSRARLAVPAVNFITDFGVHPLWVHRGIDLNLAVHETPAATARERSGRPTLACVPLVSGEYEAARDPALRAAARAQLGLLEGEVAVLIVAGSWGIGGIGDGFEAVTCAGRFVPVVVCGHDGRLHRRVASLASLSGAPAVVLGWTDQMPALMAACDALVENAGGLTSL
ncbi:MAG: MGDG synthase family glycosyltransferase, partial [Acidimicrobiales bacterium]